MGCKSLRYKHSIIYIALAQLDDHLDNKHIKTLLLFWEPLGGVGGGVLVPLFPTIFFLWTLPMFPKSTFVLFRFWCSLLSKTSKTQLLFACWQLYFSFVLLFAIIFIAMCPWSLKPLEEPPQFPHKVIKTWSGPRFWLSESNIPTRTSDITACSV